MLVVRVCAVAASFAGVVAACGSGAPSSSNAPQPGGTLPSGGSDTAPTSSAPAGTGTIGTQGMTPATGTGPVGDVADAGSDATVEAGKPTANCTPITWQNQNMVPNPTVVAVAPDAGKGNIFDQTTGLDAYNYGIQEFFFTGTSPVAYTTRMVVKKPNDPAKFSGTVFVEWYNVSGLIDVAVIWANSSDYFMREGHAFVAVSAQQAGANELKNIDSVRYAPINHPGDTYADDIFSQAAVAIRLQTDTLLGPCMPVQAVIAGGQSQSAAEMSTYLNTTQPKAHVYDGFDIHSGPEPASNNPGTPTLQIFTMNEGNGALGDGPNLVEWEVAGATHNDAHIVQQAEVVAPLAGIDASAILQCSKPMNEFPAYRVYNAAIDHLIRWVRKGEKPPAGKPFQTSGGTLSMDAHNNALGGIRSQDIDVPIATYGESGNGPSDPTNFIASLACDLGGETVPFTPDVLMQLYPTHNDYVTQYTAAADKTLAAGFELQADHDDAIKQAQAAPIPK